MSLFITLEGPDGCGKSTMAKLLSEELSKQYQVVTTREPGGTPIGEKIRDIILDNNHQELHMRTEALLYAASRAQHVEEKIRPALESGAVVLCERFVLSSLVYQSYARGQQMEEILSINEFATKDIVPDIVLLFQTEEQTVRRKLEDRADRLENAGEQFHRKVQEGYGQLKSYQNHVHLIDATKSIEEVYAQCLQVIREVGGIQ